jgi:hypothetical protein
VFVVRHIFRFPIETPSHTFAGTSVLAQNPSNPHAS